MHRVSTFLLLALSVEPRKKEKRSSDKRTKGVEHKRGIFPLAGPRHLSILHLNTCATPRFLAIPYAAVIDMQIQC